MKPARPEDIPSATHSGVWEIGGMKINVHRLDDGRTVIEADDFHKITQWLLGERVDDEQSLDKSEG